MSDSTIKLKASITEMDCGTLRAHVLISSAAITARLISADNSLVLS